MNDEITGADVQTIRRKRGMSQYELAEILAVDRSTVSKWESGDRPISRAHQRLIRVMVLGKAS